jgi:CRP/FNR family transcriptional regulator, cyclic AMP receptor protein
MTVDIDLMRHMRLFEGLDGGALERIGQALLPRTVPAADVVFLEEEPAGNLYLVTQGVVRLFKTSAEGKEQTLEMVRPGGLLNEIGFFDRLTNPFSAAATGEVIIYGLSHADYTRLAVEFPRLTENMVALLVERMRRLVALVEDLSFRTVSARIAKILLQSASGGFGGARLTQREMAAMAGTAREVVGQSLKYLEENAAIRFDKHRIVISDKGALEALAGVGET